MATEWIYYCNALTVNKPLGDAMGVALDPDPGATEAFTTKLRHTGSDDTEPSAWFAAVPLKQSGYDIVSEFASGGYPAALLGKTALIEGVLITITESSIDAARAALTLQYGPRSEVEGNGLAFIAAQGFEIIPEADA